MDSYIKRRSFGSYFGLLLKSTETCIVQGCFIISTAGIQDQTITFKTLQLSLHFRATAAVDGKALPSYLFIYNTNPKQTPRFLNNKIQ